MKKMFNKKTLLMPFFSLILFGCGPTETPEEELQTQSQVESIAPAATVQTEGGPSTPSLPGGASAPDGIDLSANGVPEDPVQLAESLSDQVAPSPDPQMQKAMNPSSVEDCNAFVQAHLIEICYRAGGYSKNAPN